MGRARGSVPDALLALVRSQPTGDGVGYVGLLLRRALDEITGVETRVVALDARDIARPSAFERLRFLARLTNAERRRPKLPVVFNHLGIARAQPHVPGRWRAPYAVFLHGTEIWDPSIDESRKSAVRQAIVRFSNSRFTASRVEAIHPDVGPVVPCPLALRPDAPPPSPIDERAAERILAGRSLAVAMVGRMSAAERYKGHDEMLDAWPLVRARVPGASLFVIGRGDDLQRLTARARDENLDDSVTYTGFLPDGVMRALLPRCALLAMPSRGEGFGLAYLEAMRAGLPCIGSAADGARDVIVDGATGFLVGNDPGETVNRRDLTRALLTLLTDDSLRRRFGENGKHREATEFSWPSFRDRLGERLSAACS